ncbi:tetratricopeptide repeat protein [Algoriphagus aquimarinus]|uniref:tetratricopeptide repeat protein n=1 Tax=Algoriphagus aquimarinus TaxID=237018 RepID=UPI000AA2C183|nr:molecular chaperone DnaJ [Algoriphagus aquimarinus]
MSIKFHPSLLLLSFVFTLAFGQVTLAQIGPNLGQTDHWMKGAKAAIERNDYETANSIFRNLIDSGQPLPEEMPYLFAETLFQLKQYDNSANFLNKYLELTGFTGSHYKGAQELQHRLETPLKEIQECQLCDRRGYRYQTCFTCDGTRQIEQECHYCKAKGVVGCSRCNGSGMITKMNIFKIVEYFECERCSGKGRLTCPVCEGSLKEVSSCRTCGGSGKLSSEDVCDHVEEAHEH